MRCSNIRSNEPWLNESDTKAMNESQDGLPFAGEADRTLLQHKINLETAQISWKEVERFFASGDLVSVAAELDLVAVALAFAEDRAEQIQGWLRQGLVGKTTVQQALSWHEHNPSLWAVVVKPWVLVQEKATA